MTHGRGARPRWRSGRRWPAICSPAGPTSSSAATWASATPRRRPAWSPPSRVGSGAAVTGPGAGLPADRLDHKRAVIEAALERTRGVRDPLALLAELGGLEIAALAGFHVAAAARQVPFVIDGVIAGAALLVADALAPGTAARAIAGHRSCEPAATVLLEHLRLAPLLDLELRLGEGTGALLAVPLVQAAARALAEMADLPV